MSLSIDKKQQPGGAYEYTATCREENYHFVITGKGETATEADTNLLDNLKEMKSRKPVNFLLNPSAIHACRGVWQAKILYHYITN